MFESVLVANRGEIAVRVIRTLRELGIRSVAVYSDADADARHVREADTAVRLGPASAAESYLSVERLLAAAERSGARAVHPGYGFLAENAAFARACADAGLVFIGPPADAIDLMGDKIRAKETVRAAGVPVVPGSTGSGLTDAELTDAAREIGMPVLLKPSAGGGGKGMRLVRDEALLAEEIAAARREARGSFGDDTLLVERWIDRPRHIEIQVLADGHGNVVHLGERECSLQRRHQKIIEEAPSVLLDEATRAAMGAAAVQAARSCGYTGAGTVEFIVPGGDPSAYYFMEMNTRLQVEHPVTELVTGLDLVEWQLRVAAGEHLDFAQDDVSLTGHAVEARICAEVPARGFLPSAGRIVALHEPEGPGVRVDSGLLPGTEVGTDYDPMLAKVIAYGPDRATALRRLRAALADTTILGLETNTGFLRRLLAHPSVVSGDLDTGLVDRDGPSLLTDTVPDEVYATAALARHDALAPAAAPDDWTDPFSVPDAWRLGGEPAWTPHHLRVPGRDPVTVRVRATASGAEVLLDAPEGAEARAGLAGAGTAAGGRSAGAPAGAAAAGGQPAGGPAQQGKGVGGPGGLPPVSGRGGVGEQPAAGAPHRAPRRARLLRTGPHRLTLDLDGRTTPFVTSPDGAWLAHAGDTWHVLDHDPVAAGGANAAAHAGALTAPMPGTVTVVKAAVGDTVTAGQSLLVVEAMKMERVIAAPHDGTVTELDVTPGSTVAMDQVLAVVTPDQPATELAAEPAAQPAAQEEA
ncbi:acetyl/propionyl/methylcrotonyl-CoA carboxylase subunit alpha [Streptomyces huiliensis]|uniref:acetyl/propionyl/methylcrotonyl-CoA carboxylase subunit alpha n=1 Tax=Streptomyces huiliensis TaxID=2876027 RepID=UPI001CBD4E9F|nr:acetyl-CoA carboxylase biotin carboxylase subunit [Streptomyces huiliensis]MBZ4319320.1 acetyl-CoA carboxylase biotin carboxylase subunit [Streptomyces huiliensis]